MGRYILKRLFQSVPLLLGIVTATFFMMRLAPGDPYLIPNAMSPVLVSAALMVGVMIGAEAGLSFLGSSHTVLGKHVKPWQRCAARGLVGRLFPGGYSGDNNPQF